MGAPDLNEEQCIYPQCEPVEAGENRLMACALRIGVILLFETNTYSFGDDIYLQEDGGPIGLKFTACVARIRKNHWARKVNKILKDS